MNIFEVKSRFAVLCLSVLCFSAISTPSFAQGAGATAVGVETIKMVPLSQTIPVTGRFVAVETGEVAARIAGPVEDVKVRVGDKVSQGQLLAVLVSERLQQTRELRLAELEKSRAALETAQAQLNIVTQELKRLERLRKSAAFNQARFDDKSLEQIKARSAVSEARASVRKAQADLELTQLDISYSEIRAPYDATVVLRHVEKGTYVNVGQAVVKLVNADLMEIEADVPAAKAAKLTPGREITIEVGEQTLAATVRAVVPDENPLTRTRAVRFKPAFDVHAQDLASNQNVTLDIPVGVMRDVVGVPKDALLAKGAGKVVYLVEDGVANIRPVQLGEPTGKYYEVLGGLKDGDMVVVRGNERLRPGQAVKPMGAQ